MLEKIQSIKIFPKNQWICGWVGQDYRVWNQKKLTCEGKSEDVFLSLFFLKICGSSANFVGALRSLPLLVIKNVLKRYTMGGGGEGGGSFETIAN